MVLRLFPNPVSVNGGLVLVGDRIKIAKRRKKMPAVKLLELIGYVDALQALVGSAPIFSAGIISGGLAIVLIGLASRRRRAAE